MVLEILSLSALALASVLGVARFPDLPSLDHVTIEASHWLANLGAFLLISIAAESSHLWPLVPCSLLLMARVMGWIYQNDCLEIILLPIATVETLMFLQSQQLAQSTDTGGILLCVFGVHILILILFRLILQRLSQGSTAIVYRWSPRSFARRPSKNQQTSFDGRI
jgi:hypothetical protein